MADRKEKAVEAGRCLHTRHRAGKVEVLGAADSHMAVEAGLKDTRRSAHWASSAGSGCKVGTLRFASNVNLCRGIVRWYLQLAAESQQPVRPLSVWSRWSLVLVDIKKGQVVHRRKAGSS